MTLSWKVRWSSRTTWSTKSPSNLLCLMAAARRNCVATSAGPLIMDSRASGANNTSRLRISRACLFADTGFRFCKTFSLKTDSSHSALSLPLNSSRAICLLSLTSNEPTTRSPGMAVWYRLGRSLSSCSSSLYFFARVPPMFSERRSEPSEASRRNLNHQHASHNLIIN